MRVETHYAGSPCVIWKNNEHYIDVRTDLRTPWQHNIEVVRNGRVYRSESVLIEQAPERICELMREELK